MNRSLLLFMLTFPSWLVATTQFDFEDGGIDDVPGPFIYDPLIGQSRANASSVRLKNDLELPSVSGSFTLEGFVSPASIPRASVDVFGKKRVGEDTAALTAGTRWLSNFKQCYWGGSMTVPGSKKATRWSTGHYVSIARLREETLGWRHLALVYDAENLTVTIWLDHWQSDSQALAAPLEWDKGPCFVSAGFDGLVDSVRLTEKVLGPEHFLRATETALTDVSFESPDTVFPPDAGHLNIRRHFGAVGDGKTDDTAAIKRAFDVVDGHQASGKGSHVLFFPAGTYLVSDTVKWRRFLRVQGENRDTTMIRLMDNAPGYGDPEVAKPVVAASAVQGPPGSNKAVNGSTIANWFHHFTVDTGVGNPGAVGVEYHSNNYGSLEHVTIRSGDGDGVMGLDLTHKTNGPTLIAHTSIEGFTTGVKTAYMEYSVTMEDVQLSGQKEVGILNRGNILALHRITSRNAVPALRTGGGNDLVSILNSELTGGAPDASAIESDGALYARNVKIGGYGKSIAKQAVTWNPHRNPKTLTEPGRDLTGDITEYISDRMIHPEGKEVRALSLPIEDPPTVPIGDLKSDWVNVRDFADLVVVEDRKEDWA
ncbi:MAG: glycosyl hydrolase family 28-related protein, partial [Verrucomicrobiota bacterium]